MTTHFSSRVPGKRDIHPAFLLRQELEQSGHKIADFSESNPTKVALPATIHTYLDELDIFLVSKLFPYQPDPRGLLAARQALLYERGYSGLQPEDIFFTSSTSESYSWLFKLFANSGEAIVVPSPGYPLFEYLAALECLEVRKYRLDLCPRGWIIDMDSLKLALMDGRARAIVLIHPNNPTGSYISQQERDAIIELCQEWDCPLICDEVFWDFPITPVISTSFFGETRILTACLGGLSKLAGLPQLKLAWIGFSGPGKEEAMARLEIIADTFLSPSAPIMYALPCILSKSNIFITYMRQRLSSNITFLQTLFDQPACPHRVLPFGGGWTTLVEAPRLLPEADLHIELLRKASIWAFPGYFFDMEKEVYFALSLILPEEEFRHIALRYVEFFKQL